MTPKAIRRALATAVAILIGVGLTASAWAQNFFYRELTKDGRIYVFALAKEFDAFDKSGEIGKAITKIGYGPNGETMIFDSEDAIGLYNLKHDRPGDVSAVAAPEKKPTMKVSWKDGKTTFETDKAALILSNRVQVRFTEQFPDATVQLPGTKAKGDSVGSFRIRRAKTKFEGWFYNKSLSYEVQLNYADTASTLEDAQISWDISNTKKFQVKLGQFKVPFGRQELTSSGSQQFVDRSQVSNEFAKGRDQGLQVFGLLGGGKLDWRAGVFNGNARNKSANDNSKYQYNARLQFAPNGDPKYSESDFESTDKLLWAIAADFDSTDFGRTVAQPAASVPPAPPATPLPKVSACPCAGNFKGQTFGVDAVVKFKAFSAFGEYFNREIKPSDGATAGSPTFKSNGYHVQVGYLIGTKRQWEVAGRYGSFDPTDDVSGNDRTEWRVGLNYFYNKHSLKVQADYGALKNKGRSTDDQELRVQTQFIF